jgi:hypothetical protein
MQHFAGSQGLSMQVKGVKQGTIGVKNRHCFGEGQNYSNMVTLIESSLTHAVGLLMGIRDD